MQLFGSKKRSAGAFPLSKGRLAPLQTTKMRRPDLGIKAELSPKAVALPRIRTLDPAELTQYMNCGGIKLSQRLNQSVEKTRSRPFALPSSSKSVMKVPTSSSTILISGFLGKGTGKLFPLRKSRVADNPEERKYVVRLPALYPEDLLLGRRHRNSQEAFLVAQKTMVMVHRVRDGIDWEPPVHPYVIQGFARMEVGEQEYRISRSYGFQSLRMLVQQFGRPSQKVIKTYIRHILSAVTHLHHHQLAHNRLNSDSVYHDGEGNCFVDWFSSSQAPPNEQERLRDFYFFPPEALLSANYAPHQKHDVWALGCIALCLLSEEPLSCSRLHPYNKPPAEGLTESGDLLCKVRQQMDQMGLKSNRAEAQQIGRLSVLSMDFISQCLCVSVERRPSALQLSSHPFLS